MTQKEIKKINNEIDDLILFNDWEAISKIWLKILNESTEEKSYTEFFIVKTPKDFWEWLYINKPTLPNILPKQYLI